MNDSKVEKLNVRIVLGALMCIIIEGPMAVPSNRRAWTAPEVQKHFDLTHASDVYAFGVMVWEILTLGATPEHAEGLHSNQHAFIACVFKFSIEGLLLHGLFDLVLHLGLDSI